jgi:hypothetical protein
VSLIQYKTLAACWTLEAFADEGRVYLEFRDGPAEGVAMDAKFLCRLALIAAMVREHFEDETLPEFADGFYVGNAAAVHTRNEIVQFTLHKFLFRSTPGWLSES